MKELYNGSDATTTQTCCLCNYIYKTADVSVCGMRYKNQLQGDEPFAVLQGCEQVVDGWDTRYEKRALYACPKCGCVQTRITEYYSGD